MVATTTAPDVGKWKGREVRCQSVDIKVRALGINRPSVEFGPIRGPAVSLQFGQFVKHVTVAQKEAIQPFRIIGDTVQHVAAGRPRVVLQEHIINQTHHDRFAEGFFEFLSIDHCALESRHQSLVFRKLFEFATDVFWNHHDQLLGLGVVKKDAVELI